MKLAYGIHGYGRGHTTRALGIISKLSPECEITIFAGGDAFDLVSASGYPVTRIPTMGYEFVGSSGKYSIRRTFHANVPRIIDIYGRGKTSRAMEQALLEHGIEMVISDSEPWLQRAANRLGIPLVSIDHYSVFAYCKLDLSPADMIKRFFTSLIYRSYMGRPDVIIASAFFPAMPGKNGVHCVGPVVRDEIKYAAPVNKGHLLVYFNKGRQFISGEVEEILDRLGCEIRIYGKGDAPPRGNLVFKTIDPQTFTGDLISCRAVISSAGNQLIGETIWLRKPVLVIPEESVDQHLNARGVEQLGVGIQVPVSRLSTNLLRGFLAREQEFRDACDRHRRDASDDIIALMKKEAARMARPLTGDGRRDISR